MSKKDAIKLCKILKKTYNFYWINKYPNLKYFFVEALDLYNKYPKKFKKVNKTFISLLYNVINPEHQPVSDYITGPGTISKYESPEYNKIIYLFGENDHSNTTGCVNASKLGKLNLYGKKNMSIEKYITELIKTSPVFIDFYVEFGIMLDKVEHVTTSSGQTLWDMLTKMKGCFGPLQDRHCPYNVRMHSVNARSILSKRYSNSKFISMDNDLRMLVLFKKHGYKDYISIENFQTKYKKEIAILSNIKNNKELIKIVYNIINKNKLIIKELKRSTLPEDKIIKFFLFTYLEGALAKIPFAVCKIRRWFSLLKKSQKIWPDDISSVSYIITVITAVVMDVYSAARMFKIFQEKKSNNYPKEPHNIIYYAGTGHTIPMARFLEKLNFQRTEHSDIDVLSCTSMKGIKQPLFSL